MDFASEFRSEFVEAYMAGKVRQVGLHSTKGSFNALSMWRGLKCMPNMHHVIRRELGVHWYVIYPQPKSIQMDKRSIGLKFDNLCRAFGFDEMSEYAEPGIVVLTEKVPRSRFYSGKDLEGEIWNQRYAPVISGFENAIHRLVPRKNILDVIFLSKNEILPVFNEADKRFKVPANMLVTRGKVDIIGTNYAHFVNLNLGRLLLSKAKKYLIEK